MASHRGTPDAGNFATVSRAFGCGAASVDALRNVLDSMTVFALRPATPGVVVCEVPDFGRWVAAFTSLRCLAWFTTKGGTVETGPVEWLSTSGADLIELLPAGVGMLIDPGQDHAVALRPEWLRRNTGDQS